MNGACPKCASSLTQQQVGGSGTQPIRTRCLDCGGSWQTSSSCECPWCRRELSMSVNMRWKSRPGLLHWCTVCRAIVHAEDAVSSTTIVFTHAAAKESGPGQGQQAEESEPEPEPLPESAFPDGVSTRLGGLLARLFRSKSSNKAKSQETKASSFAHRA